MKGTVKLERCPLCKATNTYKLTNDDNVCANCTRRIKRVSIIWYTRRSKRNWPKKICTLQSRLYDVHLLIEQAENAENTENTENKHRLVPTFLHELSRILNDCIIREQELKDINELLAANKKLHR